MDYKIVFENQYLKIIRLKNGVLVNIYKCEIGNMLLSVRGKDIRKIDDYTYALRDNYTDKFSEKTYSMNTKLYKCKVSYYLINKIYKDKKDWFWELKTTGNSFSGKTEKFQDLINLINEIIKES